MTLQPSQKRISYAGLLVALLTLGLFLAFLASNPAWAAQQAKVVPYAQRVKLLADDGAVDDAFGKAVAISGDTVVIGAYQDDDLGDQSGSAYIFDRHPGEVNAWTQVAKLTADVDQAAGDFFGWSVAISHDTVVVGAYQDADGAGIAYVFERNQGGSDNWGQVTTLTTTNEAGGLFGYSVAISGDLIVVGAPTKDSMSLTNAGAAYLFERNEGGANHWGQVAELTASDAADDDQFGYSVAIASHLIVVGAPFDAHSAQDAGSAYLFERNEANWEQITKLTAEDPAPSDKFGFSVSVSDSRVVLGAPEKDGNAGAAYIFERDQGGYNNWGQAAKLITNESQAGDAFGASVSMSRDLIAIGGPSDENNLGAFYIFARYPNGWREFRSEGPKENSGDLFGDSVAISDKLIVVGVPRDDETEDDAGAAYVEVSPFIEVQVLSEDGSPAAGAFVYRQSDREPEIAYPLDSPTDETGLVLAEAYLDDGLIALLPISNTDVYTLYHTSGAINPNSSLGLDFQIVSNPTELQQLTVSANNPLLLFNLTISIQWDARNETEFMTLLHEQLKNTSSLLYDWTNGQAALGKITIYHEREHWNEADIHIYASNRYHPNADVGGVVALEMTDPLTPTAIYKPGYVRMGPAWTRYGDSADILADDWAAALAHELGHYLFFLEDNYLGMDSTGALITIENCQGVMSNPYTEKQSEFYPINAAWDSECALTLSNLLTGRSDWESISTFYPSLTAPQLSFSEVYTGPHSLPLDVTEVDQILPNTPVTTLTDTFFNVYEPDDVTLLTEENQARSILFQGSTDSLIDLGGPIGGQFLLRGARLGVNDRLCIFDLDVTPPRLGCETVTLDDTRLRLNELPDTWTPDVLIDPESITKFRVEVRDLPSGLTLQARFYLTNGASTGVQQMQENTQDVYSASFTGLELATGGGYVHIWINEPEPRREIILDYSLGGTPGPIVGGGGHVPIISGDGKVMLLGDLVFPEGQFYLLHTTTSLPDLPSSTFAAQKGYWLSATNAAPALTPETVTINFDYLGLEIPVGSESNLQVYHYDQTNRGRTGRWIPLETTLNETENYAAAQVQGEGLYVVLSTYRYALPIILR